MITVNSLSGGKTSSYIAANYPADYNVFALVRTNDKNCLFPDKKIRQIVSDKLGVDFIGTLEMDEIIFTMLDLEQFTGKEIKWVSGETFDDLIDRHKKRLLPSPLRRYCTENLKTKPIFHWWYKNIKPNLVEMRIGFRANESKRANNVMKRTNEKGLLSDQIIVGQHESGRNKWDSHYYSKPVFPLIDDKIFKDTIEGFWDQKPVRFAELNNCVGCFHRNPILLRKLWDSHENKMQVFSNYEEGRKYINDTFKADGKITYKKIKEIGIQGELTFDDFSECDSGYCGI